jgi:hypothetical protein
VHQARAWQHDGQGAALFRSALRKAGGSVFDRVQVGPRDDMAQGQLGPQGQAGWEAQRRKRPRSEDPPWARPSYMDLEAPMRRGKGGQQQARVRIRLCARGCNELRIARDPCAAQALRPHAPSAPSDE